MPYIKGTENEFKGFGGVDPTEPLTKMDICGVVPDSSLCKAVEAEVKVKLNGLYNTAKDELNGIATLNPILAAALAGVKHPNVILNRATQLGNLFSGNVIEQDAFKLFYSYGRAGMDMLESYASIPGMAAMVDAAKRGIDAYPNIIEWSNRTQKRGIDASTVVDSVNLVSTAMTSAVSIASAFDSNLSATMNKVVNYLQLAGTCVSSIAAGAAGGPWGVAAGAVICGLSILAKVFGGAKDPPDPYAYLHGTFVPTPHQQPIIAKDAQRLATLLRYHYGVPSFEVIVNGLNQLSSSRYQVVSHAYPLVGSREPYPGFTMRDIEGVAWYLSGGKAFDGEIIKRYVPIIVSGPISSTAQAKIIMEAANKAAQAGTSDGVVSAATVKMAEWINFFAAISMIDIEETKAFAWEAFPVRTRVTGYRSQWINPDEIQNGLSYGNVEAYQSIGIIRLMAAFSYMLMQYKRGSNITSDVNVFSAGKDIIKSLPSYGSIALRVPVNPKSAVVGGKYQLIIPSILANKMKAIQSRMQTIENAAKNAAIKEADVDLSGEALRNFLIYQYGAPTAAIATAEPVGVQLLKAGLVQMTPEAAQWWKPQTTTQAPSGVGTVAVVGAAALAALMLLRK